MILDYKKTSIGERNKQKKAYTSFSVNLVWKIINNSSLERVFKQQWANTNSKFKSFLLLAGG